MKKERKQKNYWICLKIIICHWDFYIMQKVLSYLSILYYNWNCSQIVQFAPPIKIRAQLEMVGSFFYPLSCLQKIWLFRIIITNYKKTRWYSRQKAFIWWKMSIYNKWFSTIPQRGSGCEKNIDNDCMSPADFGHCHLRSRPASLHKHGISGYRR